MPRPCALRELIERQPLATKLAELPFRHAVRQFSAAQAQDADAVFAAYGEALATLSPEGASFPSHNVLLARRWLVVIPRSREDAVLPQGLRVSANALAYTGTVLVTSHEEAERVREAGVLRLLRLCAEAEP